MYDSEKGRWIERDKDPDRGRKAETERQMCILENVFFNIANDLFKTTRLTASPEETLFTDFNFIKTLAVL